MPLPTLLVIIVLASGELASFELGPPLEPELPPDDRVQFILADFAGRTDFLWDMDPTTAAQALLRRLDTPLNPSDQIHVIQALGMAGRPLGAPAVEKFAAHPDPALRLAAIRSLGQMGKFSSIPLIEPYLQNADSSLRRTALVALGKFGKPDLIPDLVEAAKRDPSLVPLERDAERRINSISSKDFPAFVDALIDTDEYQDLLPMLMFTWESLRDLLPHKDRGVRARRRAVKILGLGRMRNASQQLVSIVADPEEPPELRLEAVVALGRCRVRSSTDLLISLLNSPDASFQDAAITSLGQLGVPQAIDPLLKKWNDRGGALRERIRLALRRSATDSGSEMLAGLLASDSGLAYTRVLLIDPSLQLAESLRVEFIEPWLSNPTASVRRDAILLLAFFGRRADASKLERLRSDPDSGNRELAERAYRRLRAAAQ